MVKFGTIGAAAILLVALLGCSPKAPTQPPQGRNVTLTRAQLQRITLVTVKRANYRRTVDTTGVVDFDNDRASPVLAPFSGPVSRLLVQPGDRVKKGQALAAVMSPDFAAAVGQYRKALVTARNARRLADLDQDLLAHRGVSAREEQQAETDAANAEADRDAALASVESLNLAPEIIRDIQQGKATPPVEGLIRSPIAGTVVERLIEPGQLLQAGTTNCFTVADLSRVWVMAHVFGSDLNSVHLGDRAQVSMGARAFSGRVENIAAEVDPTTRSVAVRIAVANPDGLLKRRMYVEVHIADRAQNSALLAPVAAILRDEENLPFVYVVQPDGSFARARVALGERSGNAYVIESGLRSGERIVADGAIFVQFMQSQ